MKKLLFISLVSILAFSACQKDEEKSQPNIAEVNINGIKTVFSDLFFYIDPHQVDYTYYGIYTPRADEDNKITILLLNPMQGVVSFERVSGIGFKIGSKTYYNTATGNFTITEVSNSNIFI